MDSEHPPCDAAPDASMNESRNRPILPSQLPRPPRWAGRGPVHASPRGSLPLARSSVSAARHHAFETLAKPSERNHDHALFKCRLAENKARIACYFSCYNRRNRRASPFRSLLEIDSRSCDPDPAKGRGPAPLSPEIFPASQANQVGLTYSLAPRNHLRLL